MTQAQGIRARLLGSFDLVVDGVRIDRAAFERPSGLRLLKLLLATPGHRVRRETAAEALWPEMDPDRSAANLRKAIHFARRALASTGGSTEAALAGDGDTLTLGGEERAGLDLVVDADELVTAIDVVERGLASEAVPETLIRLGGEELLPEDPYDEWLIPIRERLTRRTIAALARAASLARASGDRGTAMRLVEVLLAREPADEAAHRLAIELHLEAGELHAARRQLQQARAAIAEAYGVEPDPALERLVEQASADRPARTAVVPSEAPIVGRVRELAASEPAFDRVAAGGSAGVLLRGPAGIGKSRLLRELAGLARASGWAIVELRGLEASPGEPFGAIAAALAASLADGIATLAEPGRSAVLTAAPGARPARAAAGVAFASDAGMTAALVGAIGAVGPGNPVAIVADDAQWLDERSLGVLEAAVRSVRPLLLAVALRDDPAIPGDRVAGLLGAVASADGGEVRIGPLGPREVQAIVERDVEGDRVDDDLADRIAELAAGVPLFALEVFRSAREGGLIERRDGRWSRRRGVDELPVPAGVSRLVERRVERIGAEARRVLATAAELGDVVAFEDLVATGVGADAVLDAVDLALTEGIVVEVGGRYAFAHPLYRAALRTGLRPRDRADVHRRIATTLARGTSPRDAAAVRRAGATGLDIAAVAAHAASAAELGRVEVAPLAVGFGIGAGERQAYLFDHAAAAATIRRALRIWQRLPEAERDAYPISHAQVELGQALRRSGDDAGAAAAFREAIGLARTDDELGAAYSAAAWLPYEHGRFATSLEILAEGRDRIQAAIPRAILESSRAWILGRSGAWAEAEPILISAVEVLEATGPSPVLMRALDRLSIAITEHDAAGSLAVLDRAMGMARELGRTGELATYEMHAGGALRQLGRLDEAAETLDRARTHARQSGEQYIEAVNEWVWAEVDETRGDDRGAIGHRRRELEIFGQIGGNARHEALAHAHIAHLARRLGDDALESFEADVARNLARHSGIPDLAARVEWSLATSDWFADQPSWDRATTEPVAPGNAAAGASGNEGGASGNAAAGASGNAAGTNAPQPAARG